MKYLTTIFLVFLISSCSDLDQRRGGVGEYCAGADDDCREGLICEAGTCALSNSDSITCDQVCSKFAECGARESGCESDCRITVEGWDSEVRESFSNCLLNASCSNISAGSAPQICYEEIEITSYEQERCDDEWRACGLNGEFRDDCYRLAKVGTDEEFQSFDDCTRLANENGTCDTHQSCIDSSAVF